MAKKAQNKKSAVKSKESSTTKSLPEKNKIKTAAKKTDSVNKKTAHKAVIVKSKTVRKPVSKVVKKVPLQKARIAQDTATLLNETMETIMKQHVDYDKFSKETVVAIKEGNEAFVKAGSLAMKGFEAYLKTVTELVQDTTEKSTEATKELMKCKTLSELTQAQNQLAQNAYDDLVASATKLSELTVKIATDTSEPLNAHFTKTYKKVSESVAA